MGHWLSSLHPFFCQAEIFFKASAFQHISQFNLPVFQPFSPKVINKPRSLELLMQ